ncbi:MAG TPA: metallophosphoesterase [Candidatus Acidoferrum sp.]|nr:metallophosphoesterase [Candidatus Acidoferrum sp.]
MRSKFLVSVSLLVFLELVVGAWASKTGAQQGGTWRFAVAGDSRNCGDVVMPGIAERVLQHKAVFFWHLGDFRDLSSIDEDMQHQPEHRVTPMTKSEYLADAWQDFIDSQVTPFGHLPVFLGIGNHELVPPKTSEAFIGQFADWLVAPILQEQRLRDDSRDHRVKTYHHWIVQGVDFVFLDNASVTQFDPPQTAWFDRVLSRAASDPGVKTVVVGMHSPLPDSLSSNHGMDESPTGVESGRRVYATLLKFRAQTRKHVYVLAGHAHFYLADIFNTPHWRNNGGVLPGWIAGTAGGQRYPLPLGVKESAAAETNVYGYLLGTVNADGEIRFQFERVSEADISTAVKSRYTPEFVHWCFAENTLARP